MKTIKESHLCTPEAVEHTSGFFLDLYVRDRALHRLSALRDQVAYLDVNAGKS